MIIIRHIGVVILFMLALSWLNGCTRGSAYILQPQWFNDVEIMVEIRPESPQVGANEFIVIATYKDKRPGFDFVISLKQQNDTRWRQAIQDGHSGVYRRAININDPVNGILIVQVVKGEEKGELSFPLNLQMQH